MKFTKKNVASKETTYPALKEYKDENYRVVVLFVMERRGIVVEAERLTEDDIFTIPKIGTFLGSWIETEFKSISGVIEFDGKE